MTTISPRVLKTTILQQTNHHPKGMDKNNRVSLMAAFPRLQNRYRTREKVLVFFEGKPNVLPWNLGQEVASVRNPFQHRKAEKFWMGLNAWKARRLFPGSNVAEDRGQINR